MSDQQYGYGSHEEHLNVNEIDHLIIEIKELENQVKKMVKIICKCLRAAAFKDAYEFMKEHNAPMTDENVKTFLLISQQAYKIRFDIMKDFLTKDFL